MSYSGAESSMDDGGAGGGGGSNNRRQTLTGNRRRRNSNNNGLLQGEEYFTGGGGGGGGGGGDGGDPEAWSAFADSFSKVQTVLDRNRMLIQQANENHQSRIPDNMVKNVAIIQELNGNISKVASIYSDLSVNFTSAVSQNRHQGGGGGGGKGGSGNGRS